MIGFDEFTERYKSFVAERDWDQFHTPKNLAEAISIEANELLELFLWHDNHPPDTVQADTELHDRVKEELADVVIYSVALATQMDIDLADAVDEKMTANEARFDEDTAADMTAELERWQRD
ncbi:nucleotide pyrophosphohydrolase [Halorubrum trueperi]|uniref:Nucleotide pyrophosphohydrolase n=1 Tax=Halorubrum trueperi TaxID=2004704 RepID=A0ABD5UH39_9EURY